MASFKELIAAAKESGYVEYSQLYMILNEDEGVMAEDIEDLVYYMEELGVKVLNRPVNK